MPVKLPGTREPDDRYEVHERESMYRGGIFEVFRERVTLPNGVEAVQEVLRYPCSVAIVPLLERRPGDPDLVLVEQFRNALRGSIHEIPAGMLEPEEDPLSCARRELEEETGYLADRWTHLATLHPTPGISASRMVYFLAEELRPAGRQNLEPTECLRVRMVPLRGLIDRVVHGRPAEGVPEIADGKTHVAVYCLAARAAGGRS